MYDEDGSELISRGPGTTRGQGSTEAALFLVGALERTQYPPTPEPHL